MKFLPRWLHLAASRPASSIATLRRRPQLEPLEDRLAPAFDLQIAAPMAGSVNIGSAFNMDSNTTTFSPTGTGAILDVADIEAELAAGRDVIVTTGTSGGEAGNIEWLAGVSADFSGATGQRSLVLRTDATGSIRSITFAGSISAPFPSPSLGVDLGLVAGGAGGDVVFAGALDGLNAISLSAGNQQVTVDNPVGAVTGINVSAATILLKANLTAFDGSDEALPNAPGVSLIGNVTVAESIAITAGHGFFPAGSVGIIGDLRLEAGADLVLATVSAAPGGGPVEYNGGVLDIGSSTLTVGPLLLLNGTLVGTGMIAGPVEVGQTGNIAPGGIGTPGVLTIDGDVTIKGTYRADVGVASDMLGVTGAVTIETTANLEGSGAFAGGSPVTLIQSTGPLTGTFAGTGPGPFLFGSSPATAAYTENGPGSLVVTPLLKGTTTQVVHVTQFGDLARFRLLGGGKARLVVVDTGDDGIIDLVRVTNATAANVLQITVLPNGGPGTVQVVRLEVEGSIGGIDAPTTRFTGTGADLLTVTGKLGRLTALELEDGNVNVASAGKLQVQHIDAVNLTSPGRIAGLFANDIASLDLTAQSLGSLSVRRNVSAGLIGDFINSSVSLTGRFGLRKEGLTAAVIDGCVQNVTINVLAGNVGSFVAALFCDSQLYVGYTPPQSGNFGDLGTFSANLLVRNFRATVVPNAFASPAFVGSQVVAAKLGTVRLSSVELNNAGIEFGLRVRNGVAGNVGSVRIANTPPFQPLVDYRPSGTGTVIPSVGGPGPQGDFRIYVQG